MNIKAIVLSVFLGTAIMGCDNDNPSQSHDFEMRVEKVEELKGVILRGIAISGTVENGCIAKEDQYTVKRDGKDIVKEIARIINIKDSQPVNGGEIKKTVKGDYVSFYIPDAGKDDVKPGDVVVSDTISCK